MTVPPDLPWQPALFASRPDFDRAFRGVERTWLDDASWVDHAAGWVTGADALFAEVLRTREWAQRTRWLWEKERLEPRLTSPWNLASCEPLAPPLLEDMRVALSERYGVLFDSVGFNLYRDGRDSVAWHGDRIRKEISEPVVVLVSLGAPRRFLMRRKGGGRSRAWQLGGGDLLVTGGLAQRTWDHSVPKVARAAPRISIAFRHGLRPDAYGPVADVGTGGSGGPPHTAGT